MNHGESFLPLAIQRISVYKTGELFFPGVIRDLRNDFQGDPFSGCGGGTDTKHYVEAADHIFRFLPLRLKSKDLKRPHGTNKRIDINHYPKIAKFYAQMIKNAE